MTTRIRAAKPVHAPSGSRKRSGMRAQPGPLYECRMSRVREIRHAEQFIVPKHIATRRVLFAHKQFDQAERFRRSVS
jgi:hypothetical protein